MWWAREGSNLEPDGCVSHGLVERAPIDGLRYQGFVDPSGGSSDSMTMAVSHLEGKVAILDAVRERRPPFKPDGVAAEFADLLRRYRIFTVRGDRYAGEWVSEAFRRHGITYVAAGKPKSDIYLELLHMNSGEVDLLDLPRLTSQLITLERRTARGGRDSVDHAPGAHDDLANAAAGAIWLAATNEVMRFVMPIIVTRPRDFPNNTINDPYGFPGSGAW